jgi:hypothetical protein
VEADDDEADDIVALVESFNETVYKIKNSDLNSATPQ